MSYDQVDPGTALLATFSRHCAYLRRALQIIRHDIEARSELHDLSKLGPEELPGFIRLSAAAREHAYATPGYMAAIKAEKPAVDHHQATNGHHPEAHADLASMPWLDIVEMVCDWWAASRTYSAEPAPWADVLAIQRERWPWTPEQWWLIEQVAATLEHG